MFACEENLHWSLTNVYDKCRLFCCIVRTKRDGSQALLGDMGAFVYLIKSHCFVGMVTPRRA